MTSLDARIQWCSIRMFFFNSPIEWCCGYFSAPPLIQLGVLGTPAVSADGCSPHQHVWEHKEPPCLRRSTWPVSGWWGYKVWLLTSAWKASEGSPKFQGIPQNWLRLQWKRASSSLLETRPTTRAKSYWNPTKDARARQENRGAVCRWGGARGSRKCLLAQCWAHAKQGEI